MLNPTDLFDDGCHYKDSKYNSDCSVSKDNVDEWTVFEVLPLGMIS